MTSLEIYNETKRVQDLLGFDPNSQIMRELQLYQLLKELRDRVSSLEQQVTLLEWGTE